MRVQRTILEAQRSHHHVRHLFLLVVEFNYGPVVFLVIIRTKMRDEKDKVWDGNTHEITTARSNSADNAISATFCSGMSMTVQSTRSNSPFASLDLFPVPAPAPSKHPCKSKYEYATRVCQLTVEVIHHDPNENRY